MCIGRMDVMHGQQRVPKDEYAKRAPQEILEGHVLMRFSGVSHVTYGCTGKLSWGAGGVVLRHSLASTVMYCFVICVSRYLRINSSNN